MFTLWSDIDRLFNHPFADWMFNENALRSAEESFLGLNRMNLTDKGENLLFVAELPGVSQDDINLSIHEDTLTLSAKRNIQHDKDNTLYLAERNNYDIQRSIALPAKIDAQNAKANFKHGVLYVPLPKAPDSKPQQNAIQN